MDSDYKTPDLSEFVAACSKEFCPWCGKQMGRNPIGRPRVFCSDRCRWAYNSWKHRKREREKHEAARTEEHTGEGSKAGSIQSPEETETG